MFSFNKLKRCDIQFEFDNEGLFEAGDLVSGTVIVTAKQDIVCDNLVIQYRWQTGGKSLKDLGDWQQKTFEVPEKKLLANEKQRIPFSFQAPEGPISYQGQDLNIDWKIRARLEPKALFDSAHLGEFILLPSALSNTYITNYEKGSSAKEQKVISAVVFFAFSFFYFLVGGIFLTILFSVLNLPTILVLPILLLVYLFRILGIMKFIRTMFVKQKLKPIEMQLSKTKVLPDDTFTCQLSFKPTKAIVAKKAIFRLKAVERVNISNTQGGGDYIERINELFVEEHVQLASFKAGTAIELEQRFQIPADAPYSFVAYENKIDWFCEVTIEIDGWPNLTKTVVLDVLPWHAPEALSHSSLRGNWSDPETVGLM